MVMLAGFTAFVVPQSTALSSSPPSVANSKVLYVDGSRCMIIPATLNKKDYQKLHPPIVIMGGIAQTISSWEHHIPALSRSNRHIVLYECIGQGFPSPPQSDRKQSNTNNKGEANMYENVSLEYQAELLMKTIDRLTTEHSFFSDGGGSPPNSDDVQVVDIVGFSFGARVAMATACLYPNRIRKLHLTGVATDRSDFGHLAVSSWKDCLQVATSQARNSSNNNDEEAAAMLLKPFAWSILLATYSAEFLRKSRVERFIQHICVTNHPPGLLALMEQAEVTDVNNPWHVRNMAKRLKDLSLSSSSPPQGHICVGEFDQMAPVVHAQELCRILDWEDELTVVPNCAHAVGIEAPRLWRSSVLKFLDK